MKPKHGFPENRLLTYLEPVPAFALLVGFVLIWFVSWWIGWSIVIVAVAVNLRKRRRRLNSRGE